MNSEFTDLMYNQETVDVTDIKYYIILINLKFQDPRNLFSLPIWRRIKWIRIDCEILANSTLTYLNGGEVRLALVVDETCDVTVFTSVDTIAIVVLRAFVVVMAMLARWIDRW